MDVYLLFQGRNTVMMRKLRSEWPHQKATETQRLLFTTMVCKKTSQKTQLFKPEGSATTDQKTSKDQKRPVRYTLILCINKMQSAQCQSQSFNST